MRKCYCFLMKFLIKAARKHVEIGDCILTWAENYAVIYLCVCFICSLDKMDPTSAFSDQIK